MKNIIRTRIYESPCGSLLLGSYDDMLCLCDWLAEKHHGRVRRRLERLLNAAFEEEASPVTGEAARQLDEYFAGRRRAFDMPLLLAGTDFQVKVWNELLKIPFGETISYGGLAQRIGMPKAVRAVANANGANPLSVFVPCHRVIGSDRSLTGYGGGIEVKRRLLELEGVRLPGLSVPVVTATGFPSPVLAEAGSPSETELATGRLVLRAWRESDAGTLYEYARDPEVGPAAGWPPHTSVEDSLNVIRTVFSAPETYAVVLKSTGEPVGSIGLLFGEASHVAGIRADEAEIGYWIGRPYWGQGLIPEAVRRLLRRCFEDLGMSAVWCCHYDGNEKSRRVMDKCGFRFHHTESGCASPPGDARTEHFMRLTKTEWEASRQLELRPLAERDIPEMQALFRDTVLHVNVRDYSREEVEDWASCGDSVEHWKDLLSENDFFAALDGGGNIIGFSSMNAGGHLHSLFVHKDWQGKGVGTRLLAEAERLVMEYGAGKITSEVSITARPFFERHGYRTVKEQKAKANRMYLTNFVMEKLCGTRILPVRAEKKRYLELLLVGDEQESMIDRYLERGEMYVMSDASGVAVAVAVVTDEGDGVLELKNIAVDPRFQRKGYGREMIEYLCRHYSGRFRILTAGTGDRNCGFDYSHTVSGFFTKNYDHPIIEEGKTLKDMVYFKRDIQ